MQVPMYDLNLLPCLVYPMENTRVETKRYLGGKAIVSDTIASINIFPKTDEEMQALYSFWEIDCNYGLKPCLFPLRFFGNDADMMGNLVLVKLNGDLKASTDGDFWQVNVEITIYPTVTYSINEQGEYIVADNYDDPITINY